MSLDFSEAMKQLNVGETNKLNLPDVNSKKELSKNTSTNSLRRPSSSAPSDHTGDDLHNNNQEKQSCKCRGKTLLILSSSSA